MTSKPIAEGRKDDTQKNRLDLLPYDALWQVGQVYSMGAKKYDDRNWEGGIQFTRVFAAMMRHAWKWFCGETFDTEDGQHHLASVVWCGLALLHYELNPTIYSQFDNRPNKEYVKPWVDPKEVETESNPQPNDKAEGEALKQYLRRQYQGSQNLSSYLKYQT